LGDIHILQSKALERQSVKVSKNQSPFLISSSSADVSYATYQWIPDDMWHSFQALWLRHPHYFQVTHVTLFL
jgi:hypothetical protein